MTSNDDLARNLIRSMREIADGRKRRSQVDATGGSSGMTHVQPFWNPMTGMGDITFGGSAGQLRRRQIGTPGQVLTVQSGVPVWAGPGDDECIIAGMIPDNTFWGPETFNFVVDGCEMSVTILSEPLPQVGWGAGAHADSGVPVTAANWVSVIEGTNGTGVNYVGVRYFDNENWTDYWQVIEAWFVASSTSATALTMLYSDNEWLEGDTILMDEPGTFRMTTTKTGDSVTTIYESPPGTVKGSYTIDSDWAANTSGIGNIWIEVVLWSESPTGPPGGTGEITNLTLETF